ncbi:hypothetical protein BH11BAC5_BH11BAC5_46300 [soil metagenome]|jgi:hypothetical protein
MYQKAEDAQQDNKTLWMGVVLVTVLEAACWLLFYWIHLQIRA